MATVLTMGTFDLPHPGHVTLLQACRKLAGPDGRVIVAINSDDFVARFKRAPVMTCDERATVVGAFRAVDMVLLNDGTDQAALIRSAKPDWLAVGADWATRDYYGQLGITANWLTQEQISLAYVAHERSADISTTALRARLAER